MYNIILIYLLDDISTYIYRYICYEYFGNIYMKLLLLIWQISWIWFLLSIENNINEICLK